MIMKKLSGIILVAVILVLVIYFVSKNNEGEQKEDKSNFIKVSNPQPNQTVTSPLQISGEARLWYFEGSFPVEILDANKKVLGVNYVQAEGEWMTTEFVPFKGTLSFDAGETVTGTLILRKDNPSGMRELDDSFSIPIRFSS